MVLNPPGCLLYPLWCEIRETIGTLNINPGCIEGIFWYFTLYAIYIYTVYMFTDGQIDVKFRCAIVRTPFIHPLREMRIVFSSLISLSSCLNLLCWNTYTHATGLRIRAADPGCGPGLRTRAEVNLIWIRASKKTFGFDPSRKKYPNPTHREQTDKIFSNKVTILEIFSLYLYFDEKVWKELILTTDYYS